MTGSDDVHSNPPASVRAVSQQLQTFVQLVEEYGATVLLGALKAATPETSGTVRRVISTAHKAKGLEWSKVRISDDFYEPPIRMGIPDPIAAEDAMLAYVSVTRARGVLDRAGLAFVDRYVTRPTPRPLAPSSGHIPRPPAPPQSRPTLAVYPPPMPPHIRAGWLEARDRANPVDRTGPDPVQIVIKPAAQEKPGKWSHLFNWMHRDSR